MIQNGNTPPLQALTDVLTQRAQNERRWANQDHLDQATWLAILTEELGEAARAILETNAPQLRAELVDLAAATLAMIEHLDRTLGPAHLTTPLRHDATAAARPAIHAPQPDGAARRATPPAA